MESNDSIVTITEKAQFYLKDILNKELEKKLALEEGVKNGVRLAVTGGGCSGLSYKIEFSSEKNKDHIIEINDLKIFIDPKSSIYLKGVVLDYKDGLNGKGFVFSNPNATNTCGCGESFSV